MTQTSRSELYGGRVIIEFKEAGHKYTVTVDGKKTKPPSVTNITGILDKPALIPWAINSTIEVTKSLILPGQYYSVQELDNVWITAKKRAREKKEEAADIGTTVHLWLQMYFDGLNPEMPPEDPWLSCVKAALAWVEKHKVKFIHNERPVYSLRHGVSGRLDGIALVDNLKSVIDFKTGNRVYGEALLQTAAYKEFYQEETGDYIGQRVIIRLGKEDGKFHSCTLTSGQEEDFQAFTGALTLFNRMKEIDKFLKEAETSTNKDWLDELS
jgi:hypothetical protein